MRKEMCLRLTQKGREQSTINVQIEVGKAKSRGATQSAVAVSLLCGGLISPLHYHPSPLYFFPLSLPDLLFAGLISLGQFPPSDARCVKPVNTCLDPWYL